MLPVLRYLRFERNVLHRDISKGNVLYIEDDTLSSTGDDVPVESAWEEQPLCFIQYLLDKRCVETLYNQVYTKSNIEPVRIPGKRRPFSSTSTMRKISGRSRVMSTRESK
jgi:hypothetical protein